jgi:hypothetical protein
VVEARSPEYDVKSLVDRRRTRLRGLVFVASESVGQLCDLLLLRFDEARRRSIVARVFWAAMRLPSP